MRSVLITGVAGLLGSRLADWISAQHPEVRVLGVDNLSGGYQENVNDKVEFHLIDCASNDLEHIFELHKPEVVFHFAAYAAEGLSPFIRKHNYHNNLIATANVINYCIKYNVSRLVFTSSMAVYGNGSPPFDEGHQPAPIDPYGIAKYACEMDIQVAGDQHGLDWCIIRPHNVYGQKQNIWDVYRNVLGIWMYQHLNGMPLTVFGDGEQKRAFSCIDDCLEPLWNAGFSENASNQIINLGSSIEYSIKEAAELLVEVMKGGEIQFIASRHEVELAHSTCQKSVDLLGFEDRTSLKEGLEQMWLWAQAQPQRERFIWKNYELDKGIYDFWRNVEQ